MLLGRCSLDALHGQPLINGFGHSPSGIHFENQGLGLFDQQSRSRGHFLVPSERIDPLGRARLLLQNQLCVSGDPCGVFCGQGNGLVEGVGVQALGASPDCPKGLNGRPGDVVDGVLLGQGPSTGLTMRAQH